MRLLPVSLPPLGPCPARLPRLRLRPVGSGALAAYVLVLLGHGLLMAGCGHAVDAAPLRYRVRLEASVASPARCSEAVGVRFVPVRTGARRMGPGLRTTAFSDHAQPRGVPVPEGGEHWACRFAYESPPLAPGAWQVVGEFADSSQSCLRVVAPGQANAVRIRQGDGCSDWDGRLASTQLQPAPPRHAAQENEP